jgi:hypothetical protein
MIIIEKFERGCSPRYRQNAPVRHGTLHLLDDFVSERLVALNTGWMTRAKCWNNTPSRSIRGSSDSLEIRSRSPRSPRNTGPTGQPIRLDLAPKTTSWTTVPTFTSWTLKANSCAPLTPTRQAIASPMHCANSWRNLAKEGTMGCYEPDDEIASCNKWSLRGLLDTARLPEAGS